MSGIRDFSKNAVRCSANPTTLTISPAWCRKSRVFMMGNYDVVKKQATSSADLVALSTDTPDCSLEEIDESR
jgi:hypothetical protein